MKKDENKNCTKPQFECGICGKLYDDIQGRVWCETACIKKQKEAAKAAAEAKKKKEQEARKVELDSAIKYATELLNNYLKDYGSYDYNDVLSNMDTSFIKRLCSDNIYYPTKLFHRFWL